MNRTNSTIILAAITLGIFFVFIIASTTPEKMMINVSAESGGERYDDKEQRSYIDYPKESNYYSSPMMDSYYSSEPPEYNPDRYGGYYDHYEGEFYLDQYFDGNPYNDNSNPYDNGSPYEIN